MKRILVRGFTIIGGLVVTVVVLVLGISIIVWLVTTRIPDTTILAVDFERQLIEDVPDDPIARVVLTQPTPVRDVVEALERAAQDDRVRALIARVGEGNLSLAQVQELRDMVLVFRRAGKSAIAYAETFGEFGPGNRSYYLATAFDAIYLHPSGDVGLSGLIAETPFLRGTLEKLNLTPRLDHREEYKTAMNVFTERQYTEAHEASTLRIIESQFGQIVRGIAEARGLTEGEVEGLIDRGPFPGREAADLKLVDGLLYRDQVFSQVKESVGPGARVLPLLTYLSRAGRPHTQGSTIALIYGVGTIKRGKSGYNPIFQGPSMGSDTVAAAFRAATRDQDVQAILFRVDSPGGSYVASDTIWRETVRARQAGKPLIVSMSGAAASGGYFISMAADKIVAQPATLTGSIGVVSGKVLTTDFWDKVGVSWDNVHTSRNATFWSPIHDYTPQQWTQLQGWLDRIYDDFTTKVAEGRELPQAKMGDIAKGRVWTGEDAKTLGLVDELGGFPVALRLAREALGLAPDAEIRLKVFPAKKTLRQLLQEQLLDNGEEEHEGDVTTTTLAYGRETFQLLYRLAKGTGLLPSAGVLAMPDLDVGR